MSFTPYANIDQSEAPLIKVTFTGVKSTDANFSAYLHEVRSTYDGGGRLGIIFDGSKASLPQPRHIKQQADWLKSHWQMMKNQCAGTAYIIPNGMIRGVLQMIFTLQEQPVPYTVVRTEDEARLWFMNKGINGGVST